MKYDEIVRIARLAQKNEADPAEAALALKAASSAEHSHGIPDPDIAGLVMKRRSKLPTRMFDALQAASKGHRYMDFNAAVAAEKRRRGAGRLLRVESAIERAMREVQSLQDEDGPPAQIERDGQGDRQPASTVRYTAESEE